jgi:hypothetical protein
VVSVTLIGDLQQVLAVMDVELGKVAFKLVSFNPINPIKFDEIDMCNICLILFNIYIIYIYIIKPRVSAPKNHLPFWNGNPQSMVELP